MTKKIILQLCADTGSDTKPYQDHPDYEVRLIGSSIGVENYDPPANVYGIIANPVCTEFSVATRDNGVMAKKRTRDLEQGLFLVQECQRIIESAQPKFWIIENPATGKLKDYLGEPTMTYEPWHYGSPWTKKTALWGNFNVPERVYHKWEDVPKLEGLYTRPNRPKPSLAFMHKSHVKFIPEFSCFSPESDMEFRSLCSQKFAQALFNANR
jgi:hypothetical protein